jgi:hypothetical protein
MALVPLHSCKKDHDISQIQEPKLENGFNPGDSCLNEINPQQVDNENRILLRAIYDGLFEINVDNIQHLGTPVMEGALTLIDSLNNGESINIVPLVDDDADSVRTLLIVELNETLQQFT